MRTATCLQSFLCLFLGLSISSSARADRMADFSAKGQNVIGVNGTTYLISTSTLTSNCSMTVTNNSSTPQTVVLSITLQYSLDGATTATYFTKTYSPITLMPNGSGTTNCVSNSSSTCTFPQATEGGGDFPVVSLAAKTPHLQIVYCSGSISVTDGTPGTPGFITAAGMLTTYMETAPGAGLGNGGGDGRTSTTTPTETPIVVSEGRPF